jgi:NADPH:quinone reductase-like Zn-dependent oxidoreductase
MKAVVHDRYGPPEVLRLDEVERPVPKDGEVLVRVRATTVTRADTHLRAGTPFVQRFQSGLFRPKRRILGHELAGEIEAVGAAVTEFEVGDRVFGALPYLGLRTGAHAEFMSVPAGWPLAPIPEGMSFEQAAAVADGAFCALNAYRPVGELRGKEILVYGASGSIGTAGVQLAKHFGAQVTAVCNTKNVELVRSLGADEVIDYLQEDFTKNGKTYDVVFDAVGKHSFRRCKSSLKPGGLYLPTDGFRNVFLWLVHKRFGDKKVVFEFPRFRKQDVVFLKGLLETGEYTPVIDRTYPLEDVVQAHRYVDTQQKTGNVVLTVDGDRAQSGDRRTTQIGGHDVHRPSS